MNMQLDYSTYNERVQQWGKETLQAVQSEAKSQGIEHRSNSPSKGASLPKLKDKYAFKDSEINKVSIKFPRALIYTHKGAGKGRAGSVGSRWVDKYGNTKTTNPKSMGRLATGGRKAKPFFNNILDSEKGVEQLAIIVAEETGNSIINKMLIQ